MKTFKILCIDGGGIKGIYSASVLAKYEDLFQVKVTDCFDLIAGTSTGGIIALGASLGIPMSDIITFYETKGPIIFNQDKPAKTKIGRCLKTLKLGCKQAVSGSKYDNVNLENALRAVFEEHTLKDSNNLLCIPAYNITAARNRVFKKDYAQYNTDNNLSYVDVAMATAAAPTYFPIKEIDDVQYIDGGLWALNPTIAALTEFVRNFYKKEPPYDYDTVSILSISSCEINIRDYASKKNRSFLEWRNTLFDIYTDGQNQSVNFFIEHITPHLAFKPDIVRVANNPLSPVQAQHIGMDHVSKDAICLLKGIGNDTAVINKDKVKHFFETEKTYKF